MKRHHFINMPDKQGGLVLMLIVSILILSIVTSIALRLNQDQAQAIYHKSTISALEDAKTALISYALLYDKTHPGFSPGYLPCPDSSGNGSSTSPCSNAGKSVIGCFPWRTLGLPQLSDVSGAPLWYAVSGGYKNNPKSVLTADTDGLFVIEDSAGNALDNTDQEYAIAVIFAPGPQVDSQGRSPDCSEPSQYLETLNNVHNDTGKKNGVRATGNLPTKKRSVFISSPVLKDAHNIVTFNDQLRWITPDDFAPVYIQMNRWIAQRISTCLDEYAREHDNYGDVPDPGDLYPWMASYNNISEDIDISGLRFGHIAIKAEEPLKFTKRDSYQRGEDDPDPYIDGDFWEMNDEWPDDPITNDNCFDQDDTDINTAYGWYSWPEWHDKVFIAVNKDKSPYPALASTQADISFDGTVVTDYLILVAGRRQNTQVRSDDAEKSDLDNYLEGDYRDAVNKLLSNQVANFPNNRPATAADDWVCIKGGC
ncbi:hypothetical protein [Candidatus Venteria ishoeyi]|uniref:Uncharacterized protein n=1 Tax=Candidatus Venteria ishoeyi TaxID=1899563 RepID=A0A1H6FAK3_9GAMM|nr:hypothetical protein [Candidatus Venteria ishoeyi]SEH06653.1 Uncharacterised protein [Candidatus Venteria ishoeyi]